MTQAEFEKLKEESPVAWEMALLELHTEWSVSDLVCELTRWIPVSEFRKIMNQQGVK
jgi:hypothetical protein